MSDIRDNLRDLVSPLRQQLSELDTEIEVYAKNLAELRQNRRDVAKVIAMLDPSSVKARVERKQVDLEKRVSQDTVAEVERRLHAGRNEVNANGGFTVTSLRRDFDFGDLSQSTLAKALAVLHQRDLIRLDHKGRGGANYFKVVG